MPLSIFLVCLSPFLVLFLWLSCLLFFLLLLALAFLFLGQVSASCTFLWFALLAFGSALVLKSYVDHKENFADAGADYKQFGFGQSPFQSAQHDAGAGAPPPPSAGYNADHRTSHDAEAGPVGVSEAEGNRNSFASSQQNVVSSADL